MDGSIPKPRSSEMAVSERGGDHWGKLLGGLDKVTQLSQLG